MFSGEVHAERLIRHMAEPVAKSKATLFLRAIADLVIIFLLVVGAAFGGYFWGIHQRLAPIADVPPGTPGAIGNLPPPVSEIAKTAAASSAPAASTSSAAPSTAAPASAATPTSTPHQGKQKYWVSSNGTDYIGYTIEVKVNDTVIDSFFSPGKTVNVTNLVRPGDNTIAFEAKALGSDYNKHSGDSSSVLTLQLIGGPTVSENFKPSDVLATYSRNAAESGNDIEDKHFQGD